MCWCNPNWHITQLGQCTSTMVKQCVGTTDRHKSLPFMDNGDALPIKSSVYDVHIMYETIKHIY
jgi:hypothetical protein